MNKSFLLSICTLPLLSACKKNDNNTPSIDKSKLYGRWVESYEVTLQAGAAPDTTFSTGFTFLYDQNYLFFTSYTPYDSTRYSVSGTTLSWLDSQGNTTLNQNIDVLNDTMLTLRQHFPTVDFVSVSKRQ